MKTRCWQNSHWIGEVTEYMYTRVEYLCVCVHICIYMCVINACKCGLLLNNYLLKPNKECFYHTKSIDRNYIVKRNWVAGVGEYLVGGGACVAVNYMTTFLNY